jgi:serine/threonine protein kinase
MVSFNNNLHEAINKISKGGTPVIEENILELIRSKDKLQPYLPSIEFIETLAEGGQGIVYRGKISGRESAVKIYFPGQIETRVDREIEALNIVNNPHIVKMLWSGKLELNDITLPVVATEYIHGVNLSEYIRQNGKLSSTQVAKIIYDISDAIEAMWGHRIVHRDLKPPNILIKSDERATVIDLGVGRHISRTPLTATGFTWGTLGYMSPEQTKAIQQLSCKSDIYSLGVIAIECLLGKHPTRGDQLLLFGMGYDKNLPIEIQKLEYAGLIANMLQVKPISRPLPSEIKTTLKAYA